MNSLAEIFSLWPSDADLGRDMEVPYPTVASWKQRGSIPPAYWRDIILAARRRGHPEINADLLVHLHAYERQDAQPKGFSEETASAFDGPNAPKRNNGEPGHFSRWKHLRRSHFASVSEINAHIAALRDEWDRR